MTNVIARELKLWWVINNSQYYPGQGLDDVEGTFETELEAKGFSEHFKDTYQYVHVIYVGDLIGISRDPQSG